MRGKQGAFFCPEGGVCAFSGGIIGFFTEKKGKKG
jgi:hypothetical protein